MTIEDVMKAVSTWTTSTDAMAALGAELTLRQSGQQAPADMAAALRAVLVAAGLDLDDLTPQQQAMALNQIRLSVHHASELLAQPARDAGWVYDDPIILEGWGRGSAMLPMMMAANPELQNVESILDVGVGVGWLAIAATQQWPNAHVVGIDIWEPSLARAREHIAEAGANERVTLRNQNILDVPDENEFDLVWVPTFFLSEDVLVQSLPGLLRATRPGGWIVLGRFATPPDPLTEATFNLRNTRAGGADIDSKRTIEIAEQAGFTEVHAVPRPPMVPLELVLGQKVA